MDAFCNIEELDQFLSAQNGRIIHQIWFNLNFRSKRLFKKFKKFQHSWVVKNPTWRYMLWTKESSLSFMKSFFPEYLSLYNNYPFDIQRIDAVRYFILYRYGGVYADMDTECIKPFDECRKKFNKNLYFVEDANTTLYGNVSNSLMFSTPKHLFWKYLFLELYERRNQPSYFSRHLQIMYSTGPGLINLVKNKYQYRFSIDIFPASLFNPLTSTTNRLAIKKEDVYTIHYSEGSWHSFENILYKIVRDHYPLLIIILLFLTSCIFKIKQFSTTRKIQHVQTCR